MTDWPDVSLLLDRHITTHQTSEGANMRIASASVLAITVVGLAGLHAAPQQGGDGEREAHASGKTYDGSWWLAADSAVRSGFINGAADCLTWSVHLRGFSATPEQLGAKISEYYRTHPTDRRRLVTDVWRTLESTAPPKTSTTTGGEDWASPHWYLDGLWWRGGSKAENTGFIEGYLWCARTYVNPPSATYSKPVSYYVDKISTYIRSNPQADDEAVATILARFRDQQKSE